MARKSFAIFFLCLYTLVLFKPLFPFIDYALNKDYIAKNLCENRNKPKMNCNGKCHLMKQLKKAGSEESTPVNNSSQKNSSQEENITHVAGIFIFNFNQTVSVKNIFSSHSQNYIPAPYSKGVFHPPQVRAFS
jgi:hypothetical protein